MKKIVTLAAFLLLLLQTSFSQEFRFGFQISPTFSWISSSDNKINGNGTNLGLRLGMLGEKYFAENYAILMGLGFAFNQGGTLRHDTGGNFWPNSSLSDEMLNTGNDALPNGINLKYGLQYVELPLALKMRTQEFGYIRYYFEIPRFTLGINTQARGAITGGGINAEKENISEDVVFFNVAWGLGGGIEYNLNESTSLIGGLFYQNGFTDATKDKNAVKNTGEAEDSKGTVSSITLRLGVMF